MLNKWKEKIELALNNGECFVVIKRSFIPNEESEEDGYLEGVFLNAEEALNYLALQEQLAINADEKKEIKMVTLKKAASYLLMQYMEGDTLFTEVHTIEELKGF